jgi:hypothetical protein
VPGVGLGGAADVEVDQLVQEGLEGVAAGDARVGGDGEAGLARDGKAETVGALARAADLELGRRAGQRPAGEDGQSAQALHLFVESDPRHLVVGARSRTRRRSAGSGLRAIARGAAPAPPQAWQRGHQ